MKFNLGKVLSVAQLIGGFVQKVQQSHPNDPGADKHAIVKELAIQALPIIEGLSGADLSRPEVMDAIDAVIVAEKAALTAKAKLEAVIAALKHGGQP